VITEDAYRKFLVWYDYSPDPRPGIGVSDVEIMIRTQYDLPGRIDTRWMLRWGVIDRDTHRELTRLRGLDPAWIDRVAEAEFRNLLIDERTRVLSALRALYREGFRTREQLEEELRALWYTNEEIELILHASDLEAELDTKRDLIAAAVDAYRKDQLDEAGLKGELMGPLIELSEERADIIVRREAIRKLGRRSS